MLYLKYWTRFCVNVYSTYKEMPTKGAYAKHVIRIKLQDIHSLLIQMYSSL